MKLLSYRSPKGDELIYSWLLNLSFYNFPGDHYGVRRVLSILHPSSGLGVCSKEPVRKDYIRGLDSMVNAINALDLDTLDPKKLLIRNTPISALGISWSRSRQAKHIRTVMQDVRGDIYDMPKAPASVKRIRICPKCMKEDPYFRVWHQLPGVSVCAVHGCDLVGLFNEDLNGDHEYDNIRQVSLDDGSKKRELNDKIRYAVCAKSIYENPSTICIDDINKYLGRPLKKMSFSAVVNLLTDADVDYKELAGNYQEQALSVPDEIEVAGSQFMIGSFKCRTCGTEWTDAFETIQLGFGCPVCMRQRSPDDVINEVLQHVGDGKYALTGHFSGMGATQTVRHQTCGKELSISMNRKIWDRAVCACERAHDIAKVEEITSAREYGFSVISYIPGEEVVTLKHDACGLTGNYLLQTFREYHSCRFCKKKNRVDAKIGKCRKALGPGYEIKSFNNKGKSEILCKRCGNVFLADEAQIREGRKCPLCVPYLTVKRFGNSPESSLYLDMQEWFKTHKLWVTRDHYKGNHNKAYYDALQVLEKKGYIYRISYGMYSYTKDLNVYEVLEEKYLKDDDGIVIGEFTNDTVRYLAGDIETEPEVITLSTKKLARKSDCKVKVCRRTVLVKGKQ